ncbi:unnamed protein product [Somion occarium]|uniref:UBC core domain-containing protein n=1 Tax=Somion occarium TaxID=3059160 RepID=A0ABP1D4U7_9APHY
MATPLKGRKKFQADLDGAAEACRTGLEVDGLLVKETSEYPNHHQFYCFSQENDPPSYVQRVIETVADYDSMTIADLLQKVLRSLAKRVASTQQTEPADAHETDHEEEDDDEEVYDEHFDADLDIAILTNKSDIDIRTLQRDFNEVVAAGYRPGLIRLGAEEIVLSVSIPVISLASDIEPRALMAWDSRMLSESHHLTLVISGMRNIYPVLQSDGTFVPNIAARGIQNLQFRVGLTSRYKPDKDLVLTLIRNYGLQAKDEELQPQLPPPPSHDYYLDGEEDESDEVPSFPEAGPQPEENDHPKFHFSLSTSLESLLHDRFLQAVQLRLKYKIGWAAAELLISRADQVQQRPEAIIHDLRRELLQADEQERELASSYNLPTDHILEREVTDHLNLPLLAFSYLLRRFTLCPRYCLVCYNRLNANFEALKPYVCDSKLCTYQYYSLNRGPSLEYEICARPETVDLLVSLAYCAAAEKVLDPLPMGMGLSVPHPSDPTKPLQEFDQLTKDEMCKSITDLLNTLHPIRDMKRFLEKNNKAGRAKKRLTDMDPNILPAAWLLLRWCVASCTAHLEELQSPEDRIPNIDSQWRQFRFSVGSPDAEAKFRTALQQAQTQNLNARRYPSLYAFHGSPTSNWHSIIRHGLWFKTVANGRAYGNGVYFAKEGQTSMSGYARGTAHRWRNTELGVGPCVAVAEIVNLPEQFVSQNPFFVVQHTDWIVCRYLLVSATRSDEYYGEEAQPMDIDVPSVDLDPLHPLTLHQKRVSIPEPTYRLQRLLDARRVEYNEEEPDEEDANVFYGIDPHTSSQVNSNTAPAPEPSIPDVVPDNWKHDPEWLASCLPHLLPPPTDASPMATMAVQRELRAMLKEQESAKSLETLGWYMPPDLIGDNLFQWIVEVHSFEPELPIAQDMKRVGVNSLVFEITFPPAFPHSPPFFRILKPRFLPFIHGGGGHVTGGGSMCMDLLTADGWLPSYSIPAIILQIKLAISNLDPRPARLASQWNQPYSMHEAIEGFKRAAATHGWRVPQGLELLGRRGYQN